MLSAVAVSGVLAAGSSDAGEILLPGEYHESNVAEGAKGVWKALCAKESSVSLMDVVVDRKPTSDDERYVDVDVKNCEQPLLLLRGLDSTLGEIETAFHGKLPLAIGTTHELAWRGTKVQIVVKLGSDAKPTPDKDFSPPRTIELVRDQKHQTLFSVGQCYLCSPSLMWAGDVDRDGALDLFFDMTDDDHGTKHELWVSVGAPTNDLVRPFAKVENSCPY
jgi:hypothetical protein